MLKKFNRGDLVTLLITAALTAGIMLTIKPTIVRGISMEPGFEDGDYLIVSKLSYRRHAPEYGDVVVLDSHRKEEKLLIKRVIGTEGDEISIDDDKVYRNGKLLREPYVNPETEGSGEKNSWTVPAGAVFVMGDNRDNSADSRGSLGTVPKEDILGKVRLRLLPLSEIRTY